MQFTHQWRHLATPNWTTDPHRLSDVWSHWILVLEQLWSWTLHSNHSYLRIYNNTSSQELDCEDREYKKPHASVADPGRGSGGCKYTPLWRLVMYFCVHNLQWRIQRGFHGFHGTSVLKGCLRKYLAQTPTYTTLNTGATHFHTCVNSCINNSTRAWATCT